jgi:hypothetical protein
MNFSVRQKFANYFGPAFHGMTLKKWMQILNNPNFKIDFPYHYRILPTTFKSLVNTRLKSLEENKFRPSWEKITIQDPVFILGHWRSGTTYLQNIFAQDPRFAFPNLYQVMNPLTFLLTEESLITKLFSLLIPKQRLFDNIPFSLKVPHEDEFIAWHSSGLTSYMGWNFPKSSEQFDQYLTLKSVSKSELSHWKSDFTQFLQKMTLKYNKPLVLKSPQHTGRISLLLDMFPGAKFIHIHRIPYRVFQSTVRLNEFVLNISAFQKPPEKWIKQRVLKQYRELYDSFFQDKKLIPKGQLAEIRFEDLESNPLREMNRIYDELDLPVFSEIESVFGFYFNQLSGYKKNTYQPISKSLKKTVDDNWERCFEKLGYAQEPVS